MTNEEIQQVNIYIAQLQSTHTKSLQDAELKHCKQLDAYKKAARIAQDDSVKMGKALYEIEKLCKIQPGVTPAQLMDAIPKIFNHFCPDYDIPF